MLRGVGKTALDPRLFEGVGETRAALEGSKGHLGVMIGLRDRKFSMGRAAAYVAGAALVIMALALVVMQHPSADEMLQRAGKASEAHKARVKKDAATAKAVAKIQKKMMQSLHITTSEMTASAGGKADADPTQAVRNKILKEENDIATLKLSTSNLFAKWEKERTIARDAQTKSVSLHEVLQQDKTKERMESKDLESLKEKLANELASRGGDGKPVADVKKEKGFTAGDSRSDLTSYFAKLNKEDEVQEAKAHANVEKAAAATEKKVAASSHVGGAKAHAQAGAADTGAHVHAHAAASPSPAVTQAAAAKGDKVGGEAKHAAEKVAAAHAKDAKGHEKATAKATVKASIAPQKK